MPPAPPPMSLRPSLVVAGAMIIAGYLVFRGTVALFSPPIWPTGVLEGFALFGAAALTASVIGRWAYRTRLREVA
jgi:hypothetical protein